MLNKLDMAHDRLLIGYSENIRAYERMPKSRDTIRETMI